MSATPPMRRPLYSAPMACAASSITGNPVPCADRHDRVQIARLPGEIDGHERLGPRRERALDRGRVDVERVGFDVDEHRACAPVDDHICRGGKGNG